MDDADEILRRCQGGGDAECAAMVRCFQPRVFRLALRVTGYAARADDATAAVLVKVWTNASKWRGESSARTWVDRVAVRTILDEVRGYRRWWRRWARTSVPEPVDPRPDAVAGAEHSEEQARLTARIRGGRRTRTGRSGDRSSVLLRRPQSGGVGSRVWSRSRRPENATGASPTKTQSHPEFRRPCRMTRAT